MLRMLAGMTSGEGSSPNGQNLTATEPAPAQAFHTLPRDCLTGAREVFDWDGQAVMATMYVVGGESIRIEFIPDGADDAPLVRIYGTARNGLTALHAALVSLANGRVASIALASLAGFVPVDATLTLSAGSSNRGIRQPADGRGFEWIATRDAFEDAALLIEPLLQSPPSGFQWLLGGEGALQWQQTGDVGLVVSVTEDGGW